MEASGGEHWHASGPAGCGRAGEGRGRSVLSSRGHQGMSLCLEGSSWLSDKSRALGTSLSRRPGGEQQVAESTGHSGSHPAGGDGRGSASAVSAGWGSAEQLREGTDEEGWVTETTGHQNR